MKTLRTPTFPAVALVTALAAPIGAAAQENLLVAATPMTVTYSGGGGTSSRGSASAGPGSMTAVPDLFTGMLSQAFPIELPQGRGGFKPTLALRYRSGNGNGWVGVGWELELGAIERRFTNGIDYAGDSYRLRAQGAAVDLVSIGGGQYRATIEGEFLRIQKIVGADGRTTWEVTDRAGTRSTYGTASASRQDDPNNPDRIYRWSIDRIQDASGNAINVAYFKEAGQIYPDTMEWGVNGGVVVPTCSVKFWRGGGRTDGAARYTTQFAVETRQYLKTIEIRAGGRLVRAYGLRYLPSQRTGRNILTWIYTYGADATLDATGAVLSTPALPETNFMVTGGPTASSRTANGPNLWAYNGYDGAWTDIHRVRYGDFNGDGLTDVLYVDGWGTAPPMRVHLASPWSSFRRIDGPTHWVYNSNPAARVDIARVKTGDFNGDGRTDILVVHGWGSSEQMRIYLAKSTTEGFESTPILGPYHWVYGGATNHWKAELDIARVMTGDFNGDGRTDILVVAGWNSSETRVYYSTGSGFVGPYAGPPIPYWAGPYDDSFSQKLQWLSLTAVKLGDFNGDRRTDIAWAGSSGVAPIWVNLASATGFGFDPAFPGPVRNTPSDIDAALRAVQGIIPADYNGDGLTDFAALESIPNLIGPYPMSVYYAQGRSFTPPVPGPARYGNDAGRLRLGDFNGDGMTDIAAIEGTGATAAVSVYMSTGSGFGAAVAGPSVYVGSSEYTQLDLDRVGTGDFNGDGRTDFARNDAWGYETPMSIFASRGDYPDLLAAMRNGIGGLVVVTYVPSTVWGSMRIPFALQTVRYVETSDGNGVSSTTSYGYYGGYFNVPERDFRGFSSASKFDPNGTSTYTSFHQGNGVDASPDDPQAAVGYTKGKPYSITTAGPDGYPSTYRTIAYWSDADGAAPYYTPVREVSSRTCTGYSVCGRQTRVAYGYDEYGNVVREDDYGDLGDPTDDRTVVRAFSPNVQSWIVGSPYAEIVYEGTYPNLQAGEIDPAHQIARTDIYYDGVTSCSSASTLITPARGLPTRIVGWLNGGTSPELRNAYDAFGNLVCRRDPNGNTETYEYDGDAVYRTAVVNALQHRTTTEYYGVNGVATAGGPFGTVKSVTDPNLATTSYQYDSVGRVVLETSPNGQYVSTAYLYGYPGGTFGHVGSQRVERTTSYGALEIQYFDGLQRTYYEKRRGGPSGRTIATKTVFDSSGRVASKCLPWVLGSTACPYSTTVAYDFEDRPVQVQNADGTIVRTCYDDASGAQSVLDSNGHLRRQVRSVAGNVTRVDEYGGVFPSCTTDVGTPYATTLYEFDASSKLRRVTDSAGTVTEISYDTLGRRVALADPSLGNLDYGYDAVGNLSWEKDAAGSIANYRYDALNRRTYEDYPTGADVEYGYDDPSSPYSKGRLSRMTDGTGISQYGYDALGRGVSVTRWIAGSEYRTVASYDNAGRVWTVTYPDGSSVGYAYDVDGFLSSVSGGGVQYASLSNYDQLGRFGSIVYGNQVSTSYSRSPAANRVERMFTVNGQGTVLDDVRYSYDPVGNLSQAQDAIDPTWSQTFTYDALDRLETATSGALGALSYTYSTTGNILQKEGVLYQYDPVRPQQVLSTSNGRTYKYDVNGNVTSDGVRKLDYDFEHRPSYVKVPGMTVSFAYDGMGKRVRKVSPDSSILYVGKLFECETPKFGAPICTRNVMAAGLRVAAVRSDGQVSYFHGDQLGSTRIVTGQDGQVRERIRYRPFGESSMDTQVTASRFKFTGQEMDAESGLYYYGARYYDPVLGRFLSPDRIVQSPADPQTLNRYGYVRNNPLKYTDPSGETFLGLSFVVAISTIGTVGQLVYELGDTLVHGGLNGNARIRKNAWDDYGDEARGILREYDPTRTGSQINNQFWIDVGFFMGIGGWETPQTVLGYGIATAGNVTGQVNSVRPYSGNGWFPCVVVDYGSSGWGGLLKGGFTLGPYISIGTANRPADDLVRHEYGHVLQSKILGITYLFVVAGPSFADACLNSSDEHDTYWTEIWANDLAKHPNNANNDYPRSGYHFGWDDFGVTALGIWGVWVIL